jgi:hypothetical protein
MRGSDSNLNSTLLGKEVRGMHVNVGTTWAMTLIVCPHHQCASWCEAERGERMDREEELTLHDEIGLKACLVYRLLAVLI